MLVHSAELVIEQPYTLHVRLDKQENTQSRLKLSNTEMFMVKLECKESAYSNHKENIIVEPWSLHVHNVHACYLLENS